MIWSDSESANSFGGTIVIIWQVQIEKKGQK